LLSLVQFFRYGQIHLLPPSFPKRQRTGALQNAARRAAIIGKRASVLDCGGPPPLFPERAASRHLDHNGRAGIAAAAGIDADELETVRAGHHTALLKT